MDRATKNMLIEMHTNDDFLKMFRTSSKEYKRNMLDGITDKVLDEIRNTLVNGGLSYRQAQLAFVIVEEYLKNTKFQEKPRPSGTTTEKEKPS